MDLHNAKTNIINSLNSHRGRVEDFIIPNVKRDGTFLTFNLIHRCWNCALQILILRSFNKIFFFPFFRLIQRHEDGENKTRHAVKHRQRDPLGGRKPTRKLLCLLKHETSAHVMLQEEY